MVAANNRLDHFTFTEERTIIKRGFNETAGDEIIAAARNYTDYSQYIFPVNTSFERFIEICNDLNSSILSNITQGKYRADLWNSDSNTLTQIPKNHTKSRTIQIEDQNDFTPAGISELLGTHPVNTDILRFDTPAFSFSFEDGLAVLSTKYDIADEINLLVEKLIGEEFSPQKTRQIADRLTTSEKNNLEIF